MVDLKIELPDGFLEEEERCGYLITKEMKKVWAVELDLLAELLRVCKKNDINIFASGGTMLGAVRHSGFIPWDDDIDMRMMREDYEKLCSVAAVEFQEPYFFQTELTDSNSLRFHAQLRNSNTTGILENEKNQAYSFNQGIFIDIFPMDKVPDDRKAFEQQCKKFERYRKWLERLRKIELGSCESDSKFKKSLINVLHACFSKLLRSHRLQKKIFLNSQKICCKYNKDDFQNCVIFALNPIKQKYKVCKDYTKSIDMKFEFFEIPVTYNFDEALAKQYGEYMKFVVGSNIHGKTILDVDVDYKSFFERLKE